MSPIAKVSEVVAAFPLSDSEIVLICSQPVGPPMAKASLYKLESGLSVKGVTLDRKRPERITLRVKPMTSDSLTIDRVKIRSLQSALGKKARVAVSPRFIQGVHSAMSLKVPHLGATFPFATTLQGLHVSVACCTGCNGGVHDRNLVVLNHHMGGGWTGIWVQTGKTIEAPYPRWQKVTCAGGVIAEVNGSMTIVDKGWMQIHKQHETPHHAPPALPLETTDLPGERTTSLAAKSLDGAWVQFQGITVQAATTFAAQERVRGAVNLPRTDIVFSDKSGGSSRASLYQPSREKVKTGQRLTQLRGFVHAEKPGVYVLLSDKEEDITL